MDVLQFVGASLEKCRLSKDNVLLKGSKIFETNNLISEGITKYGFAETEIKTAVEAWVSKQADQRAKQIELTLQHSPEVVLAEIFAKHGIEYDEGKNTYRINGNHIKRKDVDNLIISSSDDIQAVYEGIKPYSWLVLIAALDAKEVGLDRENRTRIRERLMFDPAYIGYAEGILDSIHDLWKINGDKDLFKSVMKHYLYNVKRRMYGMTAKWVIMPYFYSDKGGAGKSYLAEQIGKSISERYCTNVTAKQYVDIERESAKIEDNYVLVMDDIEHLDDSGVATIRSLMGAETWQIRKMKSQTQYTAVLVAQPIATCNFPISQTIRDDSGFRRFFQIEFGVDKSELTDELKTRQNDLIAQFGRLWKGIDENCDGYATPDCPCYGQLCDIQKSYATHDNLDEWMRSKGWDYAEKECPNMVWMKLSDVRSDYNVWCQKQGYRFPINPGKIGSLLSKRTLNKRPKNIQHFGFKVAMDEAEENQIDMEIKNFEMGVF